MWELYDGSTRLQPGARPRAEQPDKLRELQRLWLIEAVKYNVLPIDDRTGERLNPELAGRPTLVHGNSQLLFGGMGRLSESSVVSIKNKSFSVTAEVEVPANGAEGVVIAQGGRFGGWSVFFTGGKANFVYNVLGIHSFATAADAVLEPGKHQVRMEFAYDGGGLAKGGGVTLYYDGIAVGTGRVGATQPMIFSADETTDVGYESGTSVSPEYSARTAGSPARSTGCRSTPAMTTTTTSSTRTNGCGSPWRDSRAPTAYEETRAFARVSSSFAWPAIYGGVPVSRPRRPRPPWRSAMGPG